MIWNQVTFVKMWPWNENHETNKQAELEEVQFLPQGGG